MVDESQDNIIIACSKNTTLVFGRNPYSVLGTVIFDLFQESAKLSSALETQDLTLINPVLITTKPLPVKAGESECLPIKVNAMFQRCEEGLLVDIEECCDEAVEGSWQSHRRLQKTVDKLQYESTVESMYDLVVNDLFQCTGYDRVMLYRFHEDFHGEVVAESKRDTILDSWIGLHFPATDIPQRSRDLYKLNRVRLVCDVASRPVDIVSRSQSGAPTSASLAWSTARAVHPCHVEYLRNMGVRATLVLAVVVREQLWGLVVCHHYSGRRFIPYQTRTACEFLVQAFSIRLTGIVELEEKVQSDRNVHIHAALIESMLKGKDLSEMLRGLFSEGANPCSLIPGTTGAAVLFGSQTVTCGSVPPHDVILTIARWAKAQPGKEPCAVTGIAHDVPGVEDTCNGRVCGALCAPLVDGGMLLWFRPEFAQRIRWAGDPASAVLGGSRAMTPRGSFEAFVESVEGRCAPWTRACLHGAEGLARLASEVLASSDEESRSGFFDRLNTECVQMRGYCASVAKELSCLIDTAGSPIFAVDLGGRVVQWNRKCAAMFGMAEDQAVGRFLHDLVREGDRARLRDVLNQAVGGEEPRPFEVSLFCHDLLLKASARRNAVGRVTGIVCVGQDVTEANAVMSRRGWEDYPRLVESSVSPIFGVDRGGRVDEWNAATAALTGLAAAAARGRLLAGEVFGSAVRLADAGVAVRLEVIIAGALEGRATRNFEFAFRSAAGAAVELLVSVCARRGDGGRAAGAVFFAQDITQRKVLELANTIRP